MLNTVFSAVAVCVAGLALYRTTRQQLPSVYFCAGNEDPFDPDWRIRVHNPTSLPIILDRITIQEPDPDMVHSFRHPAISLRGGIERVVKELEAAPGEAPPGGSRTRPVREIHLCIQPKATEDLRFNIRAGEDAHGDPEPYSIHFDLEWSHELPFPDASIFRWRSRRIVKNTDQLEALRLAAPSTEPDRR